MTPALGSTSASRGELDLVFDERTQTFGYVQPERSNELIELSREPSRQRIAYRR